MEQRNIGFALCGSFCTLEKAIGALEELAERYASIWPVMSEVTACTDTRFGQAARFRERVEELCGKKIITTVKEAEPIGPQKLLDALVICPCTGNTLAKLARGIADTPVTLAVKSVLRNGSPVLLGVSTNDGLTRNGESIGILAREKHVYFIPYGQDDSEHKPGSLVADFAQTAQAAEAALRGEQMEPRLTRG